MLRPARLLALNFELLCQRASTLRLISPPAACQILSVLALTQVGLSPTSN